MFVKKSYLLFIMLIIFSGFVCATAPTAPNLLYPVNGDAFGELPEFNWTESSDVDNDPITYEIQIDNDSDFSSVTYSNSSMSVTSVMPTLPIMYTYFWRVKASDGYAESSWSSVRNFTYVVWNVTFNVSNYETGLGVDLIGISCNYTNFNQAGDTTNMYGPYAFPPGDWECTFNKTVGLFPKTKIFTADSDKIVNVIMSESGKLTYEEHTWLEALYNCIILKDCDLYNLLLEINQTVGNTWQHVKPTDESVITSETAVSNTLNSTSNITYDYTVNIPIKAGYGQGDYLPVRVGFWFMDETNTTCYNQGTLPTGVTLIEPYCQPLMVETIGPMGGSVNFRVDLRPNLTAGTYNVKRIIEIDPLGDWIGYGQEIIDTISVTENVNGEGDVNLEKTGENMPQSNFGDSSVSSSSSGGSSGGGSSSHSNDSENSGPTIINQNTYVNQTIVNVNNTYVTEGSDTTQTELKDGGLGGLLTGAGIISLIDGVFSKSSLVAIIIALFTITLGLVGYIYWSKKK